MAAESSWGSISVLRSLQCHSQRTRDLSRTSSTLPDRHDASRPPEDTEDTIFDIPILVNRSPPPTVPQFSPSYPTTTVHYIVGLFLPNVVSLLPSTFHDITPILFSDGNDDIFRASSAVATTATEISPPHATMGTVVMVLVFVVGLPSSS
ncbi:uncharacterized protein ARMOST_20387 [Armillaria ostoyae]|uniref:Uncharacterized protein n=1 Tax=Armillaria ostoyae TaxID=47428 RepID=A0A284S763_ARMOS|nr:uncharacterized protein ARMOST_20387 [Armillaria ostoyae]